MSAHELLEGVVVTAMVLAAAMFLSIAVFLGSFGAAVLFGWFAYCLRKALFDFAAEEVAARLNDHIEIVVWRLCANDQRNG